MRVVVLGASGAAGSQLAQSLSSSGVDVVAAHRGSGVDASTGSGLPEAFADADIVVDCTNVATTKRHVAEKFFGDVAAHVADAATAAGVERIICLSIINASTPEVNAHFGYYAGKARQEKVYRSRADAGSPPVSFLYSAQWFELAESMLSQVRVGPVAFVPHMQIAPLAMREAVGALAQMVGTESVGSEMNTDVSIAGPQRHDIVDLSRAIADKRGEPSRVIGVNIGGKALRNGGLLPSSGTVTATVTFDEWLAER